MATHAKSARGVKRNPASAARPATIPIIAARVAEMSGCTARAKTTAPDSRSTDRPRRRKRNHRPTQRRPPARMATLKPLMAIKCVSPVVAKSTRAGAAPSRSVPITMHARTERDSRSGHRALAARRAEPVAARARHRAAASASDGPDSDASRQPVAGSTIVPADPLTLRAVAAEPSNARGGFHHANVSMTSPGRGIVATAACHAARSSTGAASSNSRSTRRRTVCPATDKTSPTCIGSPCFQRDVLGRGSPIATVARVRIPSGGNRPMDWRQWSHSHWATSTPMPSDASMIDTWSARRALATASVSTMS